MPLAFASALARAFPLTTPGGALVCRRTVAKPSTQPARRPPARWLCATASSAAETVRNAIASSPIMVFSGSYCPYCTRVKALFEELGAEHTVWELDLRADGGEIRSFLAEETGQTSVPNVFIGGKHVGGCDGTWLRRYCHGTCDRLCDSNFRACACFFHKQIRSNFSNKAN